MEVEDKTTVTTGTPWGTLDWKDRVRKLMVAGCRENKRDIMEFAECGFSENKGSQSNVLITSRIGRTRISCFLGLDVKEAEPDMELISLKVVDEVDNYVDHQQEDDAFADEIEIDDGDDNSSLALECESLLLNLINEFDLIDETKLSAIPGRDDGCLLDAAFLALVAALERLCFPKVTHKPEEDTVEYNWNILSPLPDFFRREVCSTFAVIGTTIVAGPTFDEAKAADAVLLAVAKTSSILSFIQVIEGSFCGDFTSKPYEQLMAAADRQRQVLLKILNNPSTDDMLIPEDQVVRLRA